MKTIGVITSGGDAPGMNACLRAVVRFAIHAGLQVIGFHRGYEGVLLGECQEMDATSVSNIIQLGGTIIKTARCEQFYHPEGRAMAAEKLRGAGVEGLVAIGGDGTFHGAHYLWQEHGIPAIGIPGTIDNDVYGTDYTVGYDTAVNIALDAIDRIRDTATSHNRLFFVEVMGRRAGFIALTVGVAGGAEMILVPELNVSCEEIYRTIAAGVARGKTSSIIVVAEGDEQGGALEIARRVGDLGPIDSRVTILGHVQRGGKPTAFDRVLASQLGAAAVQALLEGDCDKMVGRINHDVVRTPLADTWEKKKGFDRMLYDLAAILAT